MRLLVTGAAGFVGAAVVGAAVARGHEVVALVRSRTRIERLAGLLPDIAVAEVDLRDEAAVGALVAEARPDAIVHTAWAGIDSGARLDRRQITDNVAAACGLVDAAARAGVGRFVGLGSQAEYGPANARAGEDDPVEPATLYGAAKLAVLHLTRQLSAQAGVSFAWARLFAAYGPHDNPNWLIPSLIETMLEGRRPRTTEGVQIWDYLFIDDVADGILSLAERTDATGVFNLGSGQPVAVRAIVEAIRDGVDPSLALVFGEVPYGPNQIWRLEADIARLRAATGWQPKVSLVEGLAETIRWHRERRQAADGAVPAGLRA